MSGISNQKLKILNLAKILNEKTDEDHKLTVNELINELSFIGISAERKSIYSDIEILREYGMDIICEKKRNNNYYIGSREFEVPELKLLVDAVQSSRFITYKKSQTLIKKLEKLTSNYEAKKLHKQVFVENRIKTVNENIYYNIDTIQNAIQVKKEVEFKYFDYSIDMKKQFRKNGGFYNVTPHSLCWVDDNYYLIAYTEKHKEIVHFRVDRIDDIKIGNVANIDIFLEFDRNKYLKKVFKMFSGKDEDVEIEFDNSLINVVVDKFGTDVFIFNKTKSNFKIKVNVIPANSFFSWILMFGPKAKIIKPPKLVKQMKSYINQIVETYNK